MKPCFRPAMIARRRKALAWILAARQSASGSLMAHRPRKACYALAILRDTPAFVAQQWRNGSIPATIAQTGIAASIGLAFGCMFGLAM